jgi:hypothetical protein
MGKLLFDESPLVVQPSLAKAIGLNEAIVLQQINYWLNQKGIGKTIRGERWIYNTVADWQKNFPFWSQETIKRTIYSLQDAQLIKSGTYNQSPTDRTKWYTINFAVVELLEALIQQEKDLADEALNDATGQNDTMGVTECYDIPESTSEKHTQPKSDEPTQPTPRESAWKELSEVFPMTNGVAWQKFDELWQKFPDPRRHTYAIERARKANPAKLQFYLEDFCSYDPDKPKTWGEGTRPAPSPRYSRNAAPAPNYRTRTD